MSRKKVSIIKIYQRKGWMNMNLNDQIRLTVMKLREEKGWSQTEFAEKLNISRSHMNKLENGHLQLSIPYLKQMADVLNVSINELIGEKEEKVMNQLALNVEEINQEILKFVVDEDYHLIQLPDQLLLTEEKLEKWKQDADSGSIIVSASGCRFVIITIRKGKETKVGFANIDHANWELCDPLFDTTDELIEWFASSIECPVIDVFSVDQVQQQLPGEEYV